MNSRDISEGGDWGKTFILGVFPLSGAFRDDADGGAVQPHEVSHLSEPTLVKVNGTVNPLVGKKSRRVGSTT